MIVPPGDLLLVLAALALGGALMFAIRRRSGNFAAPATDRRPSDVVLIAFASQSGFAESIAWRTAGLLQASGVTVSLAELNALQPPQIACAGRVLFIVSTTGKGNAPDNARLFASKVMRRKADLGGVQYSLLALGDRSYDNFCRFGLRLDRWLRAAGAASTGPLIEVDNADAGALNRWQRELKRLGLNDETAKWRPGRYFRWSLADRTLLNPGSPGGAIFKIALSPVDKPPIWKAGDIAEIFPGPASDAFSGNAAPRREYTVASLPGDGRLELVVRQARRADGGFGAGSGWLTETAAIGDRIAVRLRENRNFHAPPDNRSMILIGNGTGIAGLRGHLKARDALDRHENWLLFGERTSAHDWLFRDELEAWRARGHIRRMDLSFSRDQEERIYVQHLLMQAAGELRAWVETGAAIYVCGSQEGMADGVNNALVAIIGESCLEQLTGSGRYRRDVY